MKEEDIVRNIVRLGILIMVFAASGAAYAGTYGIPSQPFYADIPSEFCGPISGDRACYMVTGVYIQCTAKGSEGQTCQTTQYSGSTPVSCASVRLSASCQCDTRTYRSTGICSYYR